MEIKIETLLSLLATQKEVNKVVGEKIGKAPTVEQYILAYNVELFEFINAVGIWKWWKHNHKVDRAKILDELADCYAFMLSAVLTQPEEIKKDDEVKKPREELLQSIKFFYDQLVQDIPTKREEMIAEAKDAILFIGMSSELEQPINSVRTFASANLIAYLVLEDLTFEEVVAAYNKKSEENINRQKNNY